MDKINEQTEFKNLAKYSMNFEIGSDHWFNTLIASVLHIGEFMKTHDRVHFNETLQKDWGEQLYNVAKDMVEWHESEKSKAVMDLQLPVLFADWRDDNCYLVESLGIWVTYKMGEAEPKEFSREGLYKYWLENIYSDEQVK